MGSQNGSPSFTVRARPEVPLGDEAIYVIEWNGVHAADCWSKEVADEMVKMLNAHDGLEKALKRSYERYEELSEAALRKYGA